MKSIKNYSLIAITIVSLLTSIFSPQIAHAGAPIPQPVNCVQYLKDKDEKINNGSDEYISYGYVPGGAQIDPYCEEKRFSLAVSLALGLSNELGNSSVIGSFAAAGAFFLIAVLLVVIILLSKRKRSNKKS